MLLPNKVRRMFRVENWALVKYQQQGTLSGKALKIFTSRVQQERWLPTQL
eukprot:gene37603-58294_t